MAVITLPQSEFAGYSPAGPANTSPLVYEEIAGATYFAQAKDSNSDVKIPLSDLANARDNWDLDLFDGIPEWQQAIAHLYSETQLVRVTSSTERKSLVFRVRANVTVEQLRINPTESTGSPAYEPWGFV